MRTVDELGHTQAGRSRIWSAVLLVTVVLSACSGPASPSVSTPSRSAPSPTSTVSPTSFETPTPSGRGEVVLRGTLVYDRTTEGDVHAIYVLRDGVEHAITQPGAYHRSGLAPDFSGLLVIPGVEMTPLGGGMLDIDGRDYRPIPAHDATLNLLPCCWSPDGSRILFSGWDDGDDSRTGIYSAAPDGSDLALVVPRPGTLADSPLSYSPDGTMILFYRAVHPDPDPHTGGSLWVAAEDGKDAHEISGTAHPADFASWSPDGELIVFANERLSGSGAIWIVRTDGSGLRQLYDGPPTAFPLSPTWSPDGREIVFAMNPNNDEFEHRPNFFAVIAADGSTEPMTVRGTGDGTFSRWPSWFD